MTFKNIRLSQTFTRACRYPVAALCATTLALSARASVLEETVVTAQKREENLQEVGISVTAFSGNQLRALGMTRTVDIAQQVPAMQLQTFSPAFTIINLRGISQNNFQDNLEAPVAVYVDGAYIPSMNAINGQLFDIKRVEVLRGPQGTLFGRNTTGGLVQYITNGASDEELNGYAEGTMGDYDQRAVEGAIGGSLTDNWRGRLAGRWEENDGYVESVTPGIRDSNGANGYTIRASTEWDLTEDLLFDLRIAYADDDDVPSGTYSINFAGFDPNTGLGVEAPGRLTDGWKHASTLEGNYSRESANYLGTLTWSLSESTELVAITHYLDMEKRYLEDAGGGLFFFPYNTPTDFTNFAQELRLSGSEGQFRWQTGLYYLDMTTETDQSVQGVTILEGFGATTDSAIQTTNSKLDSSNWSVFGQGEYDLADQWTLIAGLRWSDDSKSIDLSQVYAESDAGIAPTEVFNIANVPIDDIDEIEYDDYAARLQLNYTMDSGTLVYGSWNRGIKGGNWSIDPLGVVALVDPANLKHQQEVLYSYELGFKSQNDWARLNSAVYYYDYNDYQAFSLLELTPQVTNSDADSWGGELELTVFPAEGLDLLLGVAYIDSSVDAVPDPFGGLNEAEFPNAPEWSVNSLARYQWDMPGGTMAAQVDGVWNAEQYIESTGSQISEEDAYLVWNARLSYTTADEAWEFAGWVKNAGDEQYRLYNLDLGLLGISQEVYAPPRWYGATVSYHF